MAVARGEAGFWPLKAILVLGRPGTGWNQKTIQKKSSRSNSATAYFLVSAVPLNLNVSHTWEAPISCLNLIDPEYLHYLGC